MSRLFIGDSGSTWREFLKADGVPHSLLVLDPSDSEFGTPGRLKLVENGKIAWERFYGSLDPLRAPLTLIAALVEAIRDRPNLDVLCFEYRPNPILRQTLSVIAQTLRPGQIYVGQKVDLDLGGFPVGPESFELPSAFPPMVKQAQRRARWIKMLEEGVVHTVDLRTLCFENSRLGLGEPLTREQLAKLQIEGLAHAETAGETVFLIASGTPTENELSRAMATTHTRRAVVTDPSRYAHLLCSFADPEGQDFGFGKIVSVDWTYMKATILNNAPPPAPIRILRLGSLRIDDSGIELGEVRPWEV